MFFELRPRTAFLSDINANLIELYREIQENAEEVYDVASTFPLWENFYYDLRAMHPTSLTRRERAIRFLYLNRFCFNGVYRTNRSGLFNVPRGQNTGAWPAKHDFLTSAGLVRNAHFAESDFATALAGVGKKDFVYLDPPYVHSARSEYGQYGYDSLNRMEMQRFLDIVNDLDRRGAYVLLSYTVSEEIAQAVPERWRIHIKVQRNVAGFSEKRRKATEMLIANYNPYHKFT